MMLWYIMDMFIEDNPGMMLYQELKDEIAKLEKMTPISIMQQADIDSRVRSLQRELATREDA